ncbi:L,D-transpeptidase family protein [Paenibacillus sp. GXUN7292]|uniref:L,D-transpeptidase family protein n=1 Tax=Paenibacillus sp. GXUN7292 TaxID=3422499 RepID=UPI003D7CFF74
MRLFRCILVLQLIVFVWASVTSSAPVLATEDPLPIYAPKSEYTIEVFPLQHRLTVYKQGKLYKQYRVAVGNPSTPTPVGVYTIIYKGKNWGPSFGPRWLGLNVPWGYYGIHGTNKPHSIGQHLSHGCIRMHNSHVLELYEIIPVGTKVTIHGHVLGDMSRDPRDLAEGDVGGDVQLIQSRLKSGGYFTGVCDGKFRSDTTAALKKFQRDRKLLPNGVVSRTIYKEMGLIE